MSCEKSNPCSKMTADLTKRLADLMKMLRICASGVLETDQWRLLTQIHNGLAFDLSSLAKELCVSCFKLSHVFVVWLCLLALLRCLGCFGISSSRHDRGSLPRLWESLERVVCFESADRTSHQHRKSTKTERKERAKWRILCKTTCPMTYRNASKTRVNPRRTHWKVVLGTLFVLGINFGERRGQ
jgi:hypothetical protein